MVDNKVVLSMSTRGKMVRIRAPFEIYTIDRHFEVDRIEFSTDNGKVINAVNHV